MGAQAPAFRPGGPGGRGKRPGKRLPFSSAWYCMVYIARVQKTYGRIARKLSLFVVLR